MMMFSDDPLLDFDRYDRQQAEELAKLPICDCCGEPIQDEYCYEINGNLICEDRLDMYFRKAVDDIIA